MKKSKMDEKVLAGVNGFRKPLGWRGWTQPKQFPNGVRVLEKIGIPGMQAASHPQNIENQRRIILDT